MPNNTSNKLSFKYFGNEPRLKEIEDYLSSDESILDFSKIVPLGDKTPYEAWNTKWNAYSIQKIKPEDWAIVYFFETAWNYPMPVINVIFEKFQDAYISFDSACEGGWFALSMTRSDCDKEIQTLEWTTEKGNDPDGKVREAFLSALSL